MPSYPPPAPQPSKKLLQTIEDAKFIIELLELEPECGHLLHTDDADPCGLHYPASASENATARQEYEAMISPQTPDEWFIEKYGGRLGKSIQARGRRLYAAKKAGAVSIGHRTPLTGGGCPVGENNLQPVSRKCEQYEKRLSNIQNEMTRYHRKVHRLGT